MIDDAPVALEDVVGPGHPLGAEVSLLGKPPHVHVEVVGAAEDKLVAWSAEAAALHGAGVVVARVVELGDGGRAVDTVKYR